MMFILNEKEAKILGKKLKRHFELTRLEYDEKKKNNSFYKPDLTRTYKKDMEDAKILKNILDLHDNNTCSCAVGKDCWYSLYKKNVVTEKDILAEVSL